MCADFLITQPLLAFATFGAGCHCNFSLHAENKIQIEEAPGGGHVSAR